MFILGSCKELKLSYSGCCNRRLSSPCSIKGCYCDNVCHIQNDCCHDIEDIGCHPVTSFSPTVSPTSTDTVGKTKLEVHAVH